MTALTVAVLAAGASGCMRTSDGSYVMRKPAAFSRLFGSRGMAVQPAPPTYAEAPTYTEAPTYAEQTPPQPVSASARSRLPKVSMPSMSIARNPPFKLADPDQPLTCHNETTPGGRIRMVCG